MNLIKVIVTEKYFQLKAGKIVGLDTKWATRLAGFVEAQGQRLFKVAKDLKMPKSSVFWINEKEAPAGTEQVDMPRGYIEPDPLEAKATAAILERTKGSKKAPRWQDPKDTADGRPAAV